jgi:hypothetical protein
LPWLQNRFHLDSKADLNKKSSIRPLSSGVNQKRRLSVGMQPLSASNVGATTRISAEYFDHTGSLPLSAGLPTQIIRSQGLGRMLHCSVVGTSCIGARPWRRPEARTQGSAQMLLTKQETQGPAGKLICAAREQRLSWNPHKAKRRRLFCLRLVLDTPQPSSRR